MKMKMKKFGKLNSIFKFSISKLGYMKILMKISETISLFSFDDLPEEDGEKVDAKNEDDNEKFGRLNLIFEFSISNLGYMTILFKI